MSMQNCGMTMKNVKEQKHYISLSEARANQVKIDWKETAIVKPNF